MSDGEDGQTNDPMPEQEQQAPDPASVDSGAKRARTLMDVMDDPAYDSTVRALRQALMPALLVELQPVWQAALSQAEEELTGDGPVLALRVIMSNPALEAEHDRILDRCRAALELLVDDAVPAALDLMDTMLAARYQGLHIERLDRKLRGTAASDNGTAPGTE